MSEDTSFREQELRSLAYLLHEPSSMYLFSGRLTEQCFLYPPARALYSVLSHAFREHNQFPNLDEAEALLREYATQQKVPIIVLQQWLADCRWVYFYSLEVTESTGESLRKFVLSREVQQFKEELLKKSPDEILESIPELRARLESIQSLGGSTTTAYCPFSSEYLDSRLKSVGSLYGGVTVPTGFPRLDERLLGGLRPGEYGFVIAAPGVGKTLFLLNVAMHNVRNGRRVYYFALDNTEQEMDERLFAHVSGIPIGSPRDYSTWRERVLQCGIEDRLCMFKFPPNSVNTHDIVRALRQESLRTGPPSLVIVDYADRIRSGRRYADWWVEQREIFDDLCAIAETENVPILSASQGNRRSLTSESVHMEHVAGAHAKLFGASHVWALSCTAEERNIGRRRLIVLKARRPECNYIIPMLCNTLLMRIVEDDGEPVSSVGARYHRDDGDIDYYTDRPRLEGRARG